jgi:hypothetical protein
MKLACSTIYKTEEMLEVNYRNIPIIRPILYLRAYMTEAVIDTNLVYPVPYVIHGNRTSRNLRQEDSLLTVVLY